MLAGQQRRAEWFCRAWGSSGAALLGDHPAQAARVNSSTSETGLSELSRGLLSASPSSAFSRCENWSPERAETDLRSHSKAVAEPAIS